MRTKNRATFVSDETWEKRGVFLLHLDMGFQFFIPLQSHSAAHTSILLLRWFSDFPIYLMAHRDRSTVETGCKEREDIIPFAFFYVCCALKCLTSSLNSQYGISGAGAAAREMWNVFVFICTSHSSCYVWAVSVCFCRLQFICDMCMVTLEFGAHVNTNIAFNCTNNAH